MFFFWGEDSCLGGGHVRGIPVHIFCEMMCVSLCIDCECQVEIVPCNFLINCDTKRPVGMFLSEFVKCPREGGGRIVFWSRIRMMVIFSARG